MYAGGLNHSQELPYGGLPLVNEGTQVDKKVFAAQIQDDPGLRAWFSTVHSKQEGDFEQWFEANLARTIEQLNPTIYGTLPASNNPTVQYTHIPPRGELPGLTIRWWFADKFGYFFDLIKPDTKEHAEPSDPLTIHHWDRCGWHELLSVNETWRQAVGPSAGQGHVHWCAPPGGRLRIFQAKNGPVVGEVLVPHAPANWDSDYPQFKSFFNLSEALSLK